MAVHCISGRMKASSLTIQGCSGESFGNTFRRLARVEKIESHMLNRLTLSKSDMCTAESQRTDTGGACWKVRLRDG
jgi:hypothetical protein